MATVKQCQAALCLFSCFPDVTSHRQQDSHLSPLFLLFEIETPIRTKDEEALDAHSSHSDDDIPTMTRRLRVRGRLRKRVIAVEDGDTDLTFKTPIRSIMCHRRILSEIDQTPHRNSTVRNIYSPIVRFLTPSKENVKCSDTSNNVLMSPEQCVFGFGSMDPLGGDEDDDDVFSPFTFIKNIPSQSQYSRPRHRDIPPKTRSTPEATLVVDLEETLVFSSLNVMEQAEYTFHTAFQDHQYKAYMILRPHVKEFLQSMAKIYELFVYTSAKKEYAEKILDILDPQRKLFRHRLYQFDCACVLGHYIKDLSILERELTKTVVLDNAPHTYPYHLMNTIPIKSWFGKPEDRELQKLIPYLQKLSTAEDFREVLKRRKDHFHRLLKLTKYPATSDKRCVTMSTTGLQATTRQNVKEIDTMKESISDIINQLQDIDPTRLSFSPFLDLDTQISLAPVSDSPESSVEELHSSSHSVSGSQRSLERPPAPDQPKSSTSCHQQPSDGFPEEPRGDEVEEGELDQTLSSPVIAEHALGGATENCISSPTPASQGDIPNGTDSPRWSPESTNLDCTVDEGCPLIGPPPESVELTLWRSEEQGQTCEATEDASEQGRFCCCCQCKCCQSGRIPAFLSVIVSLLCATGILYALYFYVPIKPPDLPDAVSRIIFTLCCCVVAAVPILLAMLMDAACQFCTGSFNPLESFPRRRAVQQLFVTASLELFLLYVLNLVVMATLLPQDQLKLVPILVALFIIGRIVYWVSLNFCSSCRGFGSGLTIFPLLAMVALNLFLIYNLSLQKPHFGTQDILYNQVTPSSWSEETSQSPSGKSNVLPTDILDAQ
ncbi:hypothetical protein LDENG_00064340 [Lucifuga dentata]|nr:hypothetical protein LDENG_00064340 [Lucifuga dentata]